jgi:hypothetical protein
VARRIGHGRCSEYLQKLSAKDVLEHLLSVATLRPFREN